MVISNEKINETKLLKAQKIISDLQNELRDYIAKGHGPFLAAIFDENDNLVAKEANSVVLQQCSHNHAEMNAIRQAEKVLNTYDLSAHNLKIYVTSEPCIMCLGGIMWSGIKEVYYGVPSSKVEQITGFDEGFKPDWFEEFARRGITVYGQIAQTEGEKILAEYMSAGKTVYKPQR